jgi:hypothetical protein
LFDLSEADWAGFLIECNLHWITPFAYRVLADNRGRVAVPPEIWRGFKKMYLLSRARTRRADAMIIPVLSAFGAAGIPVIALKGMHLSTQVYDDPSMRPMIDADLLVRPGDLPAAARIVESFGFRQRNAGAGPVYPGRASEEGHHLGAFRPPAGPPIELHHHLLAPHILRGIDMEGLWSRARPARIGDAAVLVLAPEDALLHLCIHAALGHVFAVKLLSLCDIPLAIRRWEACLDWEVFWSRAHAWGAERSALVTLALIRYRLCFPLPDRASRPLLDHPAELGSLMAIAEAQMRRKARALARRARSHSAVDIGGNPAIDVLMALGRMPTFGGRLRVVARRIFIPRAELSAWFGLSSQPFWLPVLHPVRIAVVAARQAFGLSRLAVLRWLVRRKEPEMRLLSWLSEG